MSRPPHTAGVMTVDNRERNRLVVRKQQARRTREERRAGEEAEIARLRARLDAAEMDAGATRFEQFPISSRTLRGLADAQPGFQCYGINLHDVFKFQNFHHPMAFNLAYCQVFCMIYTSD